MLRIYKVTQGSKIYNVKEGDYLVAFYWQKGWHNIKMATTIEKQRYIGYNNIQIAEVFSLPFKSEESIQIEFPKELKKLIPHFHKEVVRILQEKNVI